MSKIAAGYYSSVASWKTEPDATMPSYARDLLPSWVPADATPFGFSMFEPWPVKFADAWYPTIEHALQASKTLDKDTRTSVMRAPSPAAARAYGKRIVPYPEWESERYGIMQGLLDGKYEIRDTSVYRRLLSWTAKIVYWNVWCDTYWGICICPSCQSRGMNMLGAMLSAKRSELIATHEQERNDRAADH